MKQLVFRQLVTLLPHRVFDGIVDKYHGNKNVRSFTRWYLLLVLIYSQLSRLRSLREFISISSAHRKKCKELGFGDVPITRSNLAKALANRDFASSRSLPTRWLPGLKRCASNDHLCSVASTTPL